MAGHHLAEINVARLRAPVDSPLVAEFVEALEPVNRIADASPGFDWRFQTDEGNATAVRPYDDELIIINLSTWTSVEALADYVYRSHHTSFLRRRREWFERLADVVVALWWVPAGHQPSLEEASARLDALRRDGPTSHAFTFRQPFPAESASSIAADDRNACPV